MPAKNLIPHLRPSILGKNDLLILNAKEVQALASMREVMSVVEKAFLELNEKDAVCPRRLIIDVGTHKGRAYYMPSYLGKTDSLAVKIVTQYEKNPQGYGLPTITASILLNDAKSGGVLALMEGTYITALRTGAASGIASKYLARRDCRTVGVVGAGVQARTQVWALHEVLREMEKVKVYDVLCERADRFAHEMSQQLGLDVEIVNTNRDCIEDSEVIVLATTSTVPVIDGDWVRKGAHINSIGVTGPGGRELDDKVVQRAKIVVDTAEGALAETGDLTIPIKNGIISENHIYAEIHEIVAGKKAGRTSDDEITVFKAVGLAVEDAAVARFVYDKASREGLGKEVDLWGTGFKK